MSSRKQESDLLSPGNLVRERWKVLRKLGSGGFGEIYECLDSHSKKKVALKLESSQSSKQLLKMEVVVLRKLQGTFHVCEYLGCGRNDRFNFIAMTLQGRNLSDLRRSQKNSIFSVSTMLKLSTQILQSIEDIHNSGFLHRDIKPSNFAMGSSLSTSRRVFIFDFGLARQYILPGEYGNIRAPRRVTGFRGTVRYASVNVHLNREIGRHDDLWSAFYMLAEMITGSLPWRKFKDKDQVCKIKQSFDHKKLVSCMPSEFKDILAHIQKLTYFDTPDYKYLQNMIYKCMQRKNISHDDKFDWETESDHHLTDQTIVSDCRSQFPDSRPKISTNNISSIKKSNMPKSTNLSSARIKLNTSYKRKILKSNYEDEQGPSLPPRLTKSTTQINVRAPFNFINNSESKEDKYMQAFVYQKSSKQSMHNNLNVSLSSIRAKKYVTVTEINDHKQKKNISMENIEQKKSAKRKHFSKLSIFHKTKNKINSPFQLDSQQRNKVESCYAYSTGQITKSSRLISSNSIFTDLYRKFRLINIKKSQKLKGKCFNDQHMSKSKSHSVDRAGKEYVKDFTVEFNNQNEMKKERIAKSVSGREASNTSLSFHSMHRTKTNPLTYKDIPIQPSIVNSNSRLNSASTKNSIGFSCGTRTTRAVNEDRFDCSNAYDATKLLHLTDQSDRDLSYSLNSFQKSSSKSSSHRVKLENNSNQSKHRNDSSESIKSRSKKVENENSPPNQTKKSTGRMSTYYNNKYNKMKKSFARQVNGEFGNFNQYVESFNNDFINQKNNAENESYGNYGNSPFEITIQPKFNDSISSDVKKSTKIESFNSKPNQIVPKNYNKNFHKTSNEDNACKSYTKNVNELNKISNSINNSTVFYHSHRNKNQNKRMDAISNSFHTKLQIIDRSQTPFNARRRSVSKDSIIIQQMNCLENNKMNMTKKSKDFLQAYSSSELNRISKVLGNIDTDKMNCNMHAGIDGNSLQFQLSSLSDTSISRSCNNMFESITNLENRRSKPLTKFQQEIVSRKLITKM